MTRILSVPAITEQDIIVHKLMLANQQLQDEIAYLETLLALTSLKRLRRKHRRLH